MSESQAANVDNQIAKIIKDKADNQCETCSAQEDDTELEIYNVGNSDGFSTDDLKYLCVDCYTENHTDQKATKQQVLNYLESLEVPFLTSGMVSKEFNVSTQTARRRLNGLIDDGELKRYELDSTQTLYFPPDFKARNEFLEGMREGIDLTDLNTDAVKSFAKQPYKVLPKAENEYWVAVPNFLDFNLGHLHSKTDAWRTYIINKHVSWFSEVPDDIKDEITFRKKYDSAKLDGTTLELSSEEERERAWDDFGGQKGPLVQREDDEKIKVQQGKEFEVLATLIDGNNLPFTPSPINPEHIRSAPTNVSLRDYQEEAWSTFEEYGSVGVFWPMGLGKSWWAMYAGGRINGEKLVVVPSSTLKQQWINEIEERAPDPELWNVETYQYLTHSDENLSEYQGENAPMLAIYDEAHYTPANKFSQLAMIEATYRIGLSASPYREDDRTEYIFALTGMPIGVDWQELVKHGVVEYPDVHVYSYRTQRQKRKDLYKLARQKPGNGLIFCDSREKGEEIAEELNIPFVNGDTPAENRLNIINDNKKVVVSRVADEGMSIPDLDWSIEYDFMGKSRRQEMQRTGRLMHGNGSNIKTTEDDKQGEKETDLVTSNGLHIIQMTDDELEKHGERLYSLEEKGFNIQLERRA